jgi:glycosyltransferase involved in cell wall biosynthesis
LKKPRILLAGHLAPPMGGIATFCQALLDSTLAGLVDLSFVQTSSRRRTLASSGRATGANIVEGLRDCGRFFRAVLAQRPDIVHICTAVGPSFLKNGLCVVFARAMACGVVLHPHCGFNRLYAGPLLWRWYCDRIFRLSSAVIVISREWSALRERLPGLAVHDMPNAIDIKPYQKIASRRSPADARRVQVLYLGHLGEVKGTGDLLEAFKIMEAGENPVDLDLVGDPLPGEDEAWLMAGAREISLSTKTVRMMPPVSGEDKLACFERADVFVFPSHYEGMPMAVLEAMAAGLPVVATAVGGIPDLIEDGVNGILVPPRAPRHLARALERLGRDASLRSRLGTRNAQISQNFHVDRYARRLAAIYDEVLGGGDRGPAGG